MKHRARLVRGRLTLKQALLTLLIATLISLVSGSLELLGHAHTMRRDIEQRTEQQIAIINGAAAEAAFQLNPELAEQIASGLFNASDVAYVMIQDDFGRVLANFDARSGPLGWLGEALFGDMLEYQAPLRYYVDDALPASRVGEIHLALDHEHLTARFLARSFSVVGISILEAFLLSLLFVLFFHVFITRPLLRVHAAIIETDPALPAQWPKPRLKGHRNDELGHLVESMDHLLREFQRGLEQRDHLHQLSHHDGLTGIANRRYFDTFLESQWAHAIQTQTPLAIIFIDIDCFKAFNDHYGHTTGDETLKSVARTLNRCIDSNTDLLARYGGEEFVCVLPGKDLYAALNTANHLRQAVLALAIPHAQNLTDSVLTLSMGVACQHPARDESPNHLLQLADARLYHAKNRGRNRIEAFRPVFPEA
ncbi:MULTISPECIES: diguanylate cyclase [unclassified Halomonas]|uniref:GGDEF domain-containing protein n=1 Tax=unclassified Halomonas TaxID=2609666 RepID=UPI0021E4EA09|nr:MULTISPECIES: GGDEF domain-containing protein [unclassified Halomonas]UYG00477.1 diguanylate cyclase [Halomonas sp. GD1P12]WNL38448.1 diguanylate cyclase [Halomonas sp. PAMB 3232]